ncbi:MAG: hypothetical protein QN195_11185 [Armatimonadota bacterium]|nr:hypothetical protein [Armatimonadota bacterium]MDR7576679.1 hypothetical protein [Armatimonadota bacterium]
MDQHLLHQPVEEVLLLRGRPLGHDPLEVLDEGDQHLPVDGRQLQPFPPRLEVALLALQLLQAGAEVADLLVAEFGRQGPRLEGLEVAVHRRLCLGGLRLDLPDLLLQDRLLGPEPLVRLRPDACHELLVAEHRLDVLGDRRLQELGPHVLLLAVVVVEALRADVVRDVDALLVAPAAEHVALAAGALDDAREEPLVAVVPLAALEVLVPLLEHLVRLLEEYLRHERVVLPLVEDLAPADLPHVDRVLEHVEDDAPAPLPAVAVPVSGLVELVADRRRALLPQGVHLEHLADDKGLLLVDDQALLLRVELVAVGHVAAHEVPALRLLLHPDLRALDDGRVLELREDAEHLEHHLPGGVRRVEGLGDALEGDAVLRELVHHLGELADLAGEPVDPEDEERVEGPRLGVVEHLLESGPVHVGAGLGVAVDLVELPLVVPLRLAEGLEPLLLRAERVLLVVLVGRDAGVERDPRGLALLVTHGGPPL